MDQLHLPPNLTEALRIARVKGMVLLAVPDDCTSYEVIRDQYEIDPHGFWHIAEETVGVHNGQGEAHVVLDRRVGARPSCSQIPIPRLSVQRGV